MPFDNLYPPLNFYLANPVSDKFSDHSHFNVSAFTIDKDLSFIDGVMIHIMPQDLYFFLYDNVLVYHPKVESTGKCKKDYVEAYIVNKSNTNTITKVMCHRKLEYLKRIYTNKIFYKTFEKFQHPETVIEYIIKSFSKVRGYGKIVKKVISPEFLSSKKCLIG